MEINWGVINQLIERKKLQPKKWSSVRQGLGHIVQPPGVLERDTLLINLSNSFPFLEFSFKNPKGVTIIVSALLHVISGGYILFECTAAMLYHRVIIHVDHLPDRAFNNSTPPSHVFTAESLLLKASAGIVLVWWPGGGCGGGKRVDIDSWAKEKQRVANKCL